MGNILIDCIEELMLGNGINDENDFNDTFTSASMNKINLLVILLN
jgi:hypothetical protein